MRKQASRPMQCLPFISAPFSFSCPLSSVQEESSNTWSTEERKWYLSSVLFSSVIWALDVVCRSCLTGIVLFAWNRKISSKLAWAFSSFHSEDTGRCNSFPALCLIAWLEVPFLPGNLSRWGNGDESRGPEIHVCLTWLGLYSWFLYCLNFDTLFILWCDWSWIMMHICYYVVICGLKSWQRNRCFMKLLTVHMPG